MRAFSSLKKFLFPKLRPFPSRSRNRWIIALFAFCALTGCKNQKGKPPVVSNVTGTGTRNVVTLAAVGDVMLARGVGAQIERHGPRYPYLQIKDTLKQYDIVFFNLECPMSHRGVARRTDVAFRCPPEQAELLKWAGFTVASLANNHTLDYGRAALTDTIDFLESAGITTVGAGEDMKAAEALRIVNVSGMKVGFLAYTDIPNAGTTILPDQPSVAGADLENMRNHVRAAVKKTDALVVSFHWGVEYMTIPSRRQKELGRAAIDEGAALVLGHHPHVLQPVQTYRGRPILYSAGGFIWDSRIRDSDKSAIFVFELSPGSARLKKTIPIRVIRGQPKDQRCQTLAIKLLSAL